MSREYTDDMLELIAVRFKLLAEPMRLRILNALREGEKNVTELVRETGSGQANVSGHLGVLRRHGLVARRKEGLNVYYRIADPTIFHLCEIMCDRLVEEMEERRRALGAS